MQKLPNLASQNILAFKLAAISCEKKFGKIGVFVDIFLLFLITYIVNIQTPPGVLRTGAEWDDTKIQGGTNENGTHGTKIIWCEKATNRNRARIRDFKKAPLPPLPENFFTGPLCLPPPPSYPVHILRSKRVLCMWGVKGEGEEREGMARGGGGGKERGEVLVKEISTSFETKIWNETHRLDYI